ncbi:hypothetical protein [Shewanella sp. GD03713]|uniref:hypothetical protein n=1 Tax=Shewanella TaxID=22 RepID=UPI00244D777D|nr:hypothetical protein [Shewanella sp. GD03713]MDH1472615.1 hypothetical protein [Shewanella sp. GD03713]
MTADNLNQTKSTLGRGEPNISAPQESNDNIINQLNAMPDHSKFDRLVGRIGDYKLALVASSIVVAVFVLQSEEVHDIWRWIKLHTQEAMATGPTLTSDPIGVFSSSFVRYTKEKGELNPDFLLPLNFLSITRFKLDAIRFMAEFTMVEKAGTWADCKLTVEGALDGADGGITPDSYIAYLNCPNRENVLLEGYELLAYPPEVNEMLAPANYFLFNSNGSDNDK